MWKCDAMPFEFSAGADFVDREKEVSAKWSLFSASRRTEVASVADGTTHWSDKYQASW